MQLLTARCKEYRAVERLRQEMHVQLGIDTNAGEEGAALDLLKRIGQRAKLTNLHVFQARALALHVSLAPVSHS